MKEEKAQDNKFQTKNKSKHPIIPELYVPKQLDGSDYKLATSEYEQTELS